MKKELVTADSGPIFSLAVIDRLDLLGKLFHKIRIPNAVWEEITNDESTEHYSRIHDYFKDKVESIQGLNDLVFIMDYGESESVILYKELNADLLLVYDKKARQIAESLDISCIGTLGLLIIAKKQKLLQHLRPIFRMFLERNRYYSLGLLNSILIQCGEKKISKPN